MLLALLRELIWRHPAFEQVPWVKDTHHRTSREWRPSSSRSRLDLQVIDWPRNEDLRCDPQFPRSPIDASNDLQEFNVRVHHFKKTSWMFLINWSLWNFEKGERRNQVCPDLRKQAIVNAENQTEMPLVQTDEVPLFLIQKASGRTNRSASAQNQQISQQISKCVESTSASAHNQHQQVNKIHRAAIPSKSKPLWQDPRTSRTTTAIPREAIDCRRRNRSPLKEFVTSWTWEMNMV